MEAEVRYWLLRPAQIVERRQACPVAYVPLGTLEWHGPQNPVGADTLQAEGLAALCARRGGGLVLPPLHYGETRSESLVDVSGAEHEEVARAMGLPPENFLPDKQPFSATEQVLNYQRLLLHILAEAESLGFRLGVLVAGHYPLIDHARAAVQLFNKRRYSKYHGMLAWAWTTFSLKTATRTPATTRRAGRPRTCWPCIPRPWTWGCCPPRAERYWAWRAGCRPRKPPRSWGGAPWSSPRS
jgi:creatinine amidohydrolase/Fe(II)-dependent formamide hydrolase-like protein